MPGMSEERKPVWPWIVVLLVGLPVLYALSGAPADILATKIGKPEWLDMAGRAFYAPLAWMLTNGPGFAGEWYQAYARWWSGILGGP